MPGKLSQLSYLLLSSILNIFSQDIWRSGSFLLCLWIPAQTFSSKWGHLDLTKHLYSLGNIVNYILLLRIKIEEKGYKFFHIHITSYHIHIKKEETKAHRTLSTKLLCTKDSKLFTYINSFNHHKNFIIIRRCNKMSRITQSLSFIDS